MIKIFIYMYIYYTSREEERKKIKSINKEGTIYKKTYTEKYKLYYFD